MRKMRKMPCGIHKGNVIPEVIHLMRKKGGGPIIQTLSICLALSMLLTTGGPAEGGMGRGKNPAPQIREMTEFRLPKPEKAPFIFPYTEEEIEMVSAVVMHEVGYCSRESKIAVANVILNRVKDGRFGANLYQVLHQRNQFGAIENYYSGRIPTDDACREAVIAAMLGEDNSRGALYFCNPAYVNSEGARRWFASLELVFTIDNQNYYK